MMHIMQFDFICIIADHIRPLKKYMLNLNLGKKSLCFMQDHKSTSISHKTNNTNKQRPQIQGKYRSVQDIRLERVFHYEALDGCPC
ncbi:hypothetical protein Syun_028038 [Stephania yunnanensis]|uniref:Uncharacterized protein n=1 Tax=Stephania yunnanensis TaxID=152371 RepID=A0AAP0EJZ9_9MAGN